jgi:hypothetical protein
VPCRETEAKGKRDRDLHHPALQVPSSIVPCAELGNLSLTQDIVVIWVTSQLQTLQKTQTPTDLLILAMAMASTVPER